MSRTYIAFGFLPVSPGAVRSGPEHGMRSGPLICRIACSESLHAIRGSAPPGVRVDGVQGLANAGEGTAQAVLGTAQLLAGVPGDHRQVAAELAGGVGPPPGVEGRLGDGPLPLPCPPAAVRA